MEVRKDGIHIGFDLEKLQRALEARERLKERDSRPQPEQSAPQASTRATSLANFLDKGRLLHVVA